MASSMSPEKTRKHAAESSSTNKQAKIEQLPNCFAKIQTCTFNILKKTIPPSWSTRTVLLRLINQSGTEVAATATGQALAGLENLLEDVVYEFDIPGKCVKKNSRSASNGISGPIELAFKFPIVVRRGKPSWYLSFS